MFCSVAVTPRGYAEAEGMAIRVSSEGRIMHDLTIHLPEGADPEKAKKAAEALTAVFASANNKEGTK